MVASQLRRQLDQGGKFGKFQTHLRAATWQSVHECSTARVRFKERERKSEKGKGRKMHRCGGLWSGPGLRPLLAPSRILLRGIMPTDRQQTVGSHEAVVVLLDLCCALQSWTRAGSTWCAFGA